MISIPEGQIDDCFVPAVKCEILLTVTSAENGQWKHAELRLWVFVDEIRNGRWGTGGHPVELEEIVDLVAPGHGKQAG
ncbi:hypothetical protein [Amycolatopsis sp. NPDC051061]|uniref:hypothetical protein n=1 Tax=Amycolatopsis sp. NPDC051061 TaxID=3155042 RepID=UPI00344AA270